MKLFISLLILFQVAPTLASESAVVSMEDFATGGTRTLIHGKAAEVIYKGMAQVEGYYSAPKAGESFASSCVKKSPEMVCQFTPKVKDAPYSCAFVTTPEGKVINGYVNTEDRSLACPEEM